MMHSNDSRPSAMLNELWPPSKPYNTDNYYNLSHCIAFPHLHIRDIIRNHWFQTAGPGA